MPSSGRSKALPVSASLAPVAEPSEYSETLTPKPAADRDSVDVHDSVEPENTKSPSQLSLATLFYDHHVDSQLILQRVELLPNLLVDFAAAANTRVADFLDSGKAVPHGAIYPPQNYIGEIITAGNIGTLRAEVSDTMLSATSMLMFHPNHPTLFPVVIPHFDLSLTREPFFDQCFSVRLIETDSLSAKEAFEVLEEAQKEVLASTLENGGNIINFETFSPAGEVLLNGMDALCGLPFDWPVCGTRGHMLIAASFSPPEDSQDPLWNTPADAPIAPPSEDMTGQSRARRSPRNSKAKPSRDYGVIWPPASMENSDRNDDVSVSRYIVRAWARAVKDDATLLVFDCGNLLRFGIRDRARQTLFISPVVDLRRIDPPFGTLMLGALICGTDDAVKRSKQISRDDSGKSKKRSRSPDGENEEGRSKLRVTDSNILKGTGTMSMKSEELSSSVLSRSAMLLYFGNGIHHSLSPTFLLRQSRKLKSSYAPSDCITVHAHKKVGFGAAGEVFRATIRIERRNAKPIVSSVPAILKISVGENVSSLRHEHKVYTHLLQSGHISGIPECFGLFEGVDCNVSLLLLSDCGAPLASRSGTYNPCVKVSDEERIQFLRILEKIHDRGVLHGDIRSWNLLLDNESHANIIDFDRARLMASELHRKREKKTLIMLLKGHNVDE
ncbi:hypothetical protein BDZ89DRAFT_1074706 [Hymenopellis radicata]|nr:hypothetical protein BDZ89DRAFT_1074706 [Hymenopellis radicata]